MAKRFHERVNLAQPFAHCGTVEVVAMGPDLASNDERPDLNDYTSVVVYTGACNVTMRATTGGLREMAAMLCAAADAMESTHACLAIGAAA